MWAVLWARIVRMCSVCSKNIFQNVSPNELQILWADPCRPFTLQLVVLSRLSLHVIHSLLPCQTIWVHIKEVSPNNLSQQYRKSAKMQRRMLWNLIDMSCLSGRKLPSRYLYCYVWRRIAVFFLSLCVGMFAWVSRVSTGLVDWSGASFEICHMLTWKRWCCWRVAVV